MQPLDRTERQELISNLLVLLDQIPEDMILKIGEYLQTHISISLSELKDLTALSGLPYSALSKFISQGIDRQYLLLAMETALVMRNHSLTDIDHCELIWTGPVSFTVTARNTLVVIKDMIANANETITLVGYRVEEFASPIISSLYEAVKRNVRVTVILDRAEDQLAVFRKMWGKQNLPEVYMRKLNENDSMQSLHAKLVITDNSNILVTSANLTYHGLIANIEIGVKIRGKTAHKAQILLNSLIRNGELVILT